MRVASHSHVVLSAAQGRFALVLVALLLLAGCAGSGGNGSGAGSNSSGRYAMSEDAYPDDPPNLSEVPDAVPRVEPRSRGGNQSVYTVLGKSYRVLDSSDGYSRVGGASFYGRKFQGYDTANGETYDMYRMTAAHRTLPLPTFARVTRVDSGQSVIVRINDRGPFHDERIIDLSYAAAARLDMLDDGTARVRVTAIDPRRWQAEQRQQQAPSATSVASHSQQRSTPAAASVQSNASSDTSWQQDDGAVFLQVAALSSADSARQLKDRLTSALSMPVRITRHDRLRRVQVGPLNDPIMVESARAALASAGFDGVRRVGGAE
ncbi:septal ring lytic transglycosylase RlpA family protein [Kushneria aurantia]|uniref:Endolytic peptidoglycan transglycosylase RlpA n=1 Tax=Kushneria aurantia TaxID=504092 RepID=A0ABV6G3N8_9GAMM|nr:septal ring lytic transglycosylase RlpA family protein [Kushneria aurantia]